MLFSSLIFLYSFLPITLFGYYVLPYKFRNYWLLIASIIFFAWGGIKYTLVLILSVAMNYCFGLIIEKQMGTSKAKRWLAIGVACNLALLFIFKYVNFLVFNFNELLELTGRSKIHQTEIPLAIGISFYTFHSISYIVDIYRGKTPAQKNMFDLSLYICMFSQLIAGPIIRYNDVWQQLRGRTHTLAKFSSGVERFMIGLARKILLANTFAYIADKEFNNTAFELGGLNAWLGMICYTLQIYYDFGGYSDMAIGLGRMFGFEFKENFDLPYMARSVKEFWRRWHMSLSSFFRDYVYIPLGGNRVTVKRQYLNLLIVFLLTGFWHGASWTFVIWGLFHGFFLVMERLFLGNILERTWKPISNLYTMLVVMFAWVLFRANDLSSGLHFWGSLFNFSTTQQQLSFFVSLMNKEVYFAFILAILGAFGFFPALKNLVYRCFSRKDPLSSVIEVMYHSASAVSYVLLLFLCSLYLIAGTFNPFIYFKF
jgi:alginate O-acetyltransferase complex protein AlgI